MESLKSQKRMRLSTIFLIVICAIFPQRGVQAQASAWTQLPVPLAPGGDVYSISIAPSDPDVIYALAQEDLSIDPSESGMRLFSSQDGGDSWIEIHHFLSGYSTLSVDPLNSDILYIGGTNGLWRSADGGKGWEKINPVGERFSIVTSSLIYTVGKATPGNNSCDYVLSRSEDGGLTWATYPIGCFDYLWQIAILASQPEIVYLSSLDYLLKSIDGGQTWLSYPIPNGGANNSLLIDPNMPSILFASGESGFILSSDGGQTWEYGSLPDGGFSQLAFSSGVIYAIQATMYSTPVYRSEDLGKTWWRSVDQLPAGAVCLEADPETPGRLMACMVGHGVMLTTNGGSSWEERNHGIQTTTVLGKIAIAPSNPDIIYAASTTPYPAIYRSIDRGKTWSLPSLVTLAYSVSDASGGFLPVELSSNPSSVTQGLGLTIYQLLVDPLHPEIAWARDDFGIYETIDGVSWRRVINSNLAFDIVVSQASPDAPFALVGNDSINFMIFHRDCSQPTCYWIANVIDSNIQAIAMDRFHGNRLYGASVASYVNNQFNGNDISYSLDGGRSWIALGHLQSDSVVKKMVVSEANPEDIVALTMHMNVCCFTTNSLVLSWRVYLSQDAGITWHEWSPNTGFSDWPAPSLISGGLGTFFYGNYDGLFARSINDDAWHLVGLQWEAVSGLSVYSSREPYLLATTNTGLWKLDLPEIHTFWFPVINN